MDDDISVHAQKIERLSSAYGCSIKVDPTYDPKSRDTYNCFEFALYLNESVHISVRAICAELDTLVDYRFIDYLLRIGDLNETIESEICDDDLVIYFLDGKAQHGGRWRKGQVTSKWGSGLLYSHGTQEVPEKYGNPRYFHVVQSNIMKMRFLEYAREQGVEEELLQDA